MTDLTIPPETTYGDVELDWIDNEPPGLFPVGNDSFWGSMRKVYCDYLQVLAFKLDQWYQNLDPRTVDLTDIAAYEEQFGIPVDTSKTLEARRAFLIARMTRGPFTRARRNAVIESFIVATFGPAIQFTTDGIPFPSGGIPFYSGSQSLAGTYSVRENLPFGANMLPNGNFETDVSGWGPSNVTLTRDTSVSKVGSASMKVLPTVDPAGVFSPALTISGATAGRVFSASCWVYGSGSALGKSVRLQFNENGGATAVEGVVSVDAVLVAGWQKLICTGAVARNDRTNIYALLTMLGTGWTGIPIWMDGAQLEESPYPRSFVDSAKTPYYYEVRIKSSVAVDIAGLTRELARITPAGISFDILSVAEVDAVREYVLNPSLDNSTGYWTLVALSGSSGTLTFGTFGIAGDNVGRVYANPGSGPNLGAQTTLYDLLSGRKYRFTAWVYNEPGMQMWVHFSSSARPDANMANSSLMSGAWQQISFDFTALPGESQITLQFVVGANYQNKSFYFDDVSVVEV